MKRFYQKLIIKFIRFGRLVKWFKEPKRSYLYNDIRLPFYTAPIHETPEGKLYIKEHELFNSVKFRKMVDKLRNLKIVP